MFSYVLLTTGTQYCNIQLTGTIRKRCVCVKWENKSKSLVIIARPFSSPRSSGDRRCNYPAESLTYVMWSSLLLYLLLSTEYFEPGRWQECFPSPSTCSALLPLIIHLHASPPPTGKSRNDTSTQQLSKVSDLRGVSFLSFFFLSYFLFFPHSLSLSGSFLTYPSEDATVTSVFSGGCSDLPQGRKQHPGVGSPALRLFCSGGEGEERSRFS